jgi:hypothetical protein
MRNAITVFVICFGVWFASEAGAQEPRLSATQNLTAQETFGAAHLNQEDRKEILGQVEKTSFDVPDSWESELRVRRLQLGETAGLVVQASSLLCGGTGNCQTWVFRRSEGKWLTMFEHQAPIASGFGFAKEQTHGLKDFITVGHMSAEMAQYAVFTFDGSFYRLTQCYVVSGDDSPKKSPC